MGINKSVLKKIYLYSLYISYIGGGMGVYFIFNKVNPSITSIIVACSAVFCVSRFLLGRLVRQEMIDNETKQANLIEKEFETYLRKLLDTNDKQ